MSGRKVSHLVGTTDLNRRGRDSGEEGPYRR